jgi:ATP-dependent RNA helicase DDX24/MAK5
VSDLKKIIQMNSNNTKVINLGKTHEERMPEKLKEYRIDTNEDLKEAISFYLIKKCEKEGGGKRRTIIFANTVDQTMRLAGVLRSLLPENGKLFTLYAKMIQRQRLRNLERFANSDAGVLVATDVACRGLDIPLVEQVIHFTVPISSDTYIHRSGRTARAGKDGISILLVSPDEHANQLKKICRQLGNKPHDIPEYPFKADVIHRLIKPACDDAKELDKLMLKNRRAGSNNKFVLQLAEAFEVGDDVLDEHLADKTDREENRKIKKLQEFLKDFQEKKFYL